MLHVTLTSPSLYVGKTLSVETSLNLWLSRENKITGWLMITRHVNGSIDKKPINFVFVMSNRKIEHPKCVFAGCMDTCNRDLKSMLVILAHRLAYSG